MATTTVRYQTDFRYTDRATKARYVAEKYALILGGSVLDVGCDERQLGEAISATRYVGIDMNPAADLVLDLEREDLPFEDRAFDTVVCADVLEHLDRCHAVFDELCRVAAGHVIVALPNPMRNMLEGVRSGAPSIKHYGLPVDPPADRHKWFFGQRDAERFLRVRGERAGFEVEQVDLDMSGCCAWRGPDGENLLEDVNFTGGNTWCVLRRPGAP